MTDHPITPPIELVQQWVAEIWHEGTPVQVAQSDLHLAARAAQWGADQELEACCEWLCHEYGYGEELALKLRAALRPNPPSLKEQALKELDKVDMLWATEEFGKETLNSLDTIRRALEALPDE